MLKNGHGGNHATQTIASEIVTIVREQTRKRRKVKKMKIVVEVSEKDYLNFLLQYDSGILDEKTPSHRAKIAIANGTPIPNGIIATDKAIGIIRKYLGYNDEKPYDTVDAIIEEIMDEADKEGADNGTD